MIMQGPAVGGGAELTTVTDFRLCTPEASVSFVQVRECIVIDKVELIS